VRSRSLAVVIVAIAALAASFGLLAQQQAAARFAVVDVYVDSTAPLAAWQFELRERHGEMQVVGVENGDSRAYTQAPYYDRAVVDRGAADRIIVASFSLRPAASGWWARRLTSSRRLVHTWSPPIRLTRTN